MAGTYGFPSKISIGGTAVAFESESLALREEFVYGGGLTGNRGERSARTRQGIRRVSGDIVLQPTPAEWTAVKAIVLGTAGSLTDALPDADIIVQRSTNIFTYAGCKVDRAVFEGTQGAPLKLTLSVVGKDETVGAGTVAGSVAAESPWMFHDLVMTVVSTARSCSQFTLTVENVIDQDRFHNSQTMTQVNPTWRRVMWNVQVPYGDNEAAYALSSTGVNLTAAFTNGASVLTMDSNTVFVARLSPTVNGQGEVMMELVGEARGTGNDELTIT